MAGSPIRRIAGVHVVILGDFNPAILHPSWLAAKGLIPPEEAEAADLRLVSSSLSAFGVGPLRLRVEKGRFEASTSDTASFLPLRDFVLGLFGILEHTPMTRMGINYLQHFQMANAEEWHSLGDRLAPKEPWVDLLEGTGDREEALPGLKSLTIEGKRPDSTAKAFSVKVQPSRKIPTGVYVETNEEFVASEDDALAELLAVLEATWSSALEFSENLAVALLGGEK